LNAFNASLKSNVGKNRGQVFIFAVTSLTVICAAGTQTYLASCSKRTILGICYNISNKIRRGIV